MRMSFKVGDVVEMRLWCDRRGRRGRPTSDVQHRVVGRVLKFEPGSARLELIDVPPCHCLEHYRTTLPRPSVLMALLTPVSAIDQLAMIARLS